MPPAKSAESTAHPPITFGPALHYTSSMDDAETQTVQRIDLNAPGDPRERAICRALLHHALALLDATEPTRKTAVAAEAGRI